MSRGRWLAVGAALVALSGCAETPADRACHAARTAAEDTANHRGVVIGPAVLIIVVVAFALTQTDRIRFDPARLLLAVSLTALAMPLAAILGAAGEEELLPAMPCADDVHFSVSHRTHVVVTVVVVILVITVVGGPLLLALSAAWTALTGGGLFPAYGVLVLAGAATVGLFASTLPTWLAVAVGVTSFVGVGAAAATRADVKPTLPGDSPHADTRVL